jgi:hypothetical protein
METQQILKMLKVMQEKADADRKDNQEQMKARTDDNQ